MTTLFWDASALAKRYIREKGTETVNALFAPRSSVRHVSSMIGYAETYSIILRAFNRDSLPQHSFQESVDALRTEVLEDPDFILLSLPDDAVLSGLSLMQKHNVNATDAALLVVFVRYQNAVGPAEPCVVIASDTRFLRAAEAQNLGAFNPETATPANAALL